jgi:hypothetical protein
MGYGWRRDISRGPMSLSERNWKYVQSGRLFPWARTGTLFCTLYSAYPQTALLVSCLYSQDCPWNYTLQTWRWRQHVAPKRRCPPTDYTVSQPRRPNLDNNRHENFNKYIGRGTGIRQFSPPPCSFHPLRSRCTLFSYTPSLYSALNVRNEANAYKTTGKIIHFKQHTWRYDIIYFKNIIIYSGIWRRVVCWKSIGVSEEHIASIFRPDCACHLISCWFLARLIFWPWKWGRSVPPKRRSTFNGLHCVI